MPIGYAPVNPDWWHFAPENPGYGSSYAPGSIFDLQTGGGGNPYQEGGNMANPTSTNTGTTTYPSYTPETDTLGPLVATVINGEIVIGHGRGDSGGVPVYNISGSPAPATNSSLMPLLLVGAALLFLMKK